MCCCAVRLINMNLYGVCVCVYVRIYIYILVEKIPTKNLVETMVLFLYTKAGAIKKGKIISMGGKRTPKKGQIVEGVSSQLQY